MQLLTVISRDWASLLSREQRVALASVRAVTGRDWVVGVSAVQGAEGSAGRV